ncbi:MAG: hypothetical protein OEO83_11545 [Alphaproteobacteria bacterium]|nr:hypothetical protein [Alphaproteobacteria bacterium]
MLNDTERAAEALERAALKSLYDNSSQKVRADLGLRLFEIEDVMALVSSKDPSIIINRAIGLGTQTPATPETIRAVCGVYGEHGCGGFFLHAFDEDLSDEARAAIEELGLVRRRNWMKFIRDPGPPHAVPTDLRIEEVRSADADDFARIACDSFEMSPATRPLVAGLAHDPRWHLFLSFDGETPAGTGGLFVDHGFGWLDWGATDLHFRRRGSQGAIMAARIALARAFHCKHLITETGEAVEGDPQHSYGNILRAGFREFKSRANYAPAPVS